MANTVIPADKRIDGAYGEVWVGSVWWADVSAISGTITVERKAVNPAGTMQTFNKRGRISREGTFTLDKVDSRIETDFLTAANTSIATRRANRGTPWFPLFNLLINLDDPDAYGAEQIQLMNCQLWTLPVGFSLSDMVTRELQFTWEYEDLGTFSPITRP